MLISLLGVVSPALRVVKLLLGHNAVLVVLLRQQWRGPLGPVASSGNSNHILL
jgi:hypothetical protein